jgi:hypothetical protein
MYIYQSARFAPRALASPPLARQRATLTPVADRVVLFGGSGSTALGEEVFFNDAWATDGRRWEEVSTDKREPAPSSRRAHSAVDFAERFVVVFGGRDGNSGLALKDTWALDVAKRTWALVPAAFTGEARKGHSAVRIGSEMIVYGGRAESNFAGAYDGDIHVLRLSSFADVDKWTWQAVDVSRRSALPQARNHHAAAAIPGTTKMVVLGGRDCHEACAPLDDGVWIFDRASNSWSHTALTPGPVPRLEAIMWVDSATTAAAPRVMLALGEGPDGELLNDVWALSLTPRQQTPESWTLLTPKNCPALHLPAAAAAQRDVLAWAAGFFLAAFTLLLAHVWHRRRGQRGKRGEYEPI